MVLSEVFLSFVVSSGIACILALGQYIFKSKCDEVKCLGGCLSIHRRVDLESGNDDGPQIELPPPLQRKRAVSLDSILKK
ncbi:MAG: hypothetical protein ASQ68_gp14 [Yellowstone Lake virophage 6]|uniref:hypothetical protein n=1 Tax=Yellowstone Lake virophage 6 TaxID=1557034 RepID=UPI000535F3CB|nr:MAG: hypothetical protein ASQ68_gp14 [Yellowstone Lake virophage 6]AIW01904.1 MAG: hypothetical protein YSLV6_ORF14 [Yellowstone Lake virophage 6]